MRPNRYGPCLRANDIEPYFAKHMRLLVIRPEPGNRQTVAAARAAGIDAVACPLFEAVPVPWRIHDPARYDCLLAGSANVFRHGGDGLAALKHVPVYAVGKATARAAQEHGFTVAAPGQGGLQAVVPRLQQDGRAAALRLSGREHVELNARDIPIDSRIVYEMLPRPLSLDKAGLDKGSWLVALHSAAAARHFALQCKALHLDTSQIALLTLGPRISEAVGDGWYMVETCDAPNDDAMLALAIRMCQKAAL